MKKIFKLKGEILIIFCISAFLSFIIVSNVKSLYRTSAYNRNLNYKNALARNKNFVDNLNRRLDVESGNEESIRENLNNNQDKLIDFGAENILLLNEDGYVYDSLFDLGMDKVDFENKEDDIEIKDSRYIARNVIKINDDLYILAISADYCKGDMDILAVWLVLSIIIFTILISGRIRYINVISSRVKKISSGNLDVKVPCKYRNELTSLAEDVNKMAANLKSEDLRQKEFITNISHDLRTPLTAILGYVKMIEEKKYTDDEELGRYIGVINRKSIYLKKLIDDFFDYSKLASEDISLNCTEINLNECIKGLLFEEEENFKKKNLHLVSEIMDEGIIEGDPMLIGRLFENIISNAVKYSREGSKVFVEVISEGKNIVFTISNIPKDELDDQDIKNIFNRLYKKDKSRKSEGNGLGLAIVSEILKIYNGSIKAEKEEDKVKFTIRLPRKI